MLKILRIPEISRPFTWLVLISFLTMTTGCYYYRVNSYASPQSKMPKQPDDPQKYFILHAGDNVWHLTKVAIDENNITGEILPLLGHETYLKAQPGTTIRYRVDEAQFSTKGISMQRSLLQFYRNVI
jgi:hypothetical protein